MKRLLLALILCQSSLANALTIYTNREPALIKAVTESFTKETGIKLDILYITTGLLERLAAEGKASLADLVYVTDVTQAELAKSRGLTQALNQAIAEDINPLFRDKDWVGLTMRTRVIFASRERVKEADLTYEDLADPRFKGKICTRQGGHPYNLALISAAIVHMKDGAKPWLQGIKDNLARRPSGGDRDVARDILSGVCDLGLANNYYLGLMQNDPAQKKWAESVKLINPTFKNGGTHINLSAAFIPKEAKNISAAERFIAHALTAKSQAQLSLDNFEFPVREGVTLSPQISQWANFTSDKISPADMASKRKEASDLIDMIGFDR